MLRVINSGLWPFLRCMLLQTFPVPQQWKYENRPLYQSYQEDSVALIVAMTHSMCLFKSMKQLDMLRVCVTMHIY